MDLGIKGETALVVGASEGIGYETAKGLLEEGAEVLICSRSADKLRYAARHLEQACGRTVHWFAADVTRAEDVVRLKAWLENETGRLDILVSAVGGSRRAGFEELDDTAWLANYEFNVLGAVRVVRAALDFLKRSDAGGRIVILGAAGARMPYEHQVVSNVHKAGLIALVKTLGAEFQKYNIRVNSVSPGRTLTSLWTTRAEKLARERGISADDVMYEFSREIPMQRFGRPEEIAAMVVFLASHKTSYVTCQSILVDGGIARGLI
ncbi:MAG: SDR family oxidoreductase [Betaproteobacteria bacterium]|nr:SDR family oxidoreductase [Betaproteobacteria bacterium]